MNGKRTRFELTDDNKIMLIAEHLVWGEWQPLFEEDVTDKVKSVSNNGMELNEYQSRSMRTLPNDDHFKNISNYALGLVSESGEVGDIIKKHVFHGHILDTQELIKELGDVLHYLAGLCTMHNLFLEDVAKTNLDKLLKRYPIGFSSAASINRVE